MEIVNIGLQAFTVYLAFYHTVIKDDYVKGTHYLVWWLLLRD